MEPLQSNTAQTGGNSQSYTGGGGGDGGARRQGGRGWAGGVGGVGARLTGAYSSAQRQARGGWRKTSSSQSQQQRVLSQSSRPTQTQTSRPSQPPRQPPRRAVDFSESSHTSMASQKSHAADSDEDADATAMYSAVGHQSTPPISQPLLRPSHASPGQVRFAAEPLPPTPAAPRPSRTSSQLKSALVPSPYAPEAGPSRLPMDATNTARRTSQAHQHDLKERWQNLAASAYDVLSFYASLNKRRERDGVVALSDGLVDQMKQKWTTLERLKTHHTLPGAQYHRYFIDVDDATLAPALLKDVEPSSGNLRISPDCLDAVHLVNCATLVHYVWAIPFYLGNVKHPEDWPCRSYAQIQDARRVFFRSIVPTTRPLDEQVLRVYLDLTTQVFSALVATLRERIQRTEISPDEANTEAYINLEEFMGLSGLEDALSLRNGDHRLIKARWKSMADRRKGELKSLRFDDEMIRAEYPLQSAAAPLTELVTILLGERQAQGSQLLDLVSSARSQTTTSRRRRRETSMPRGSAMITPPPVRSRSVPLSSSSQLDERWRASLDELPDYIPTQRELQSEVLASFRSKLSLDDGSEGPRARPLSRAPESFLYASQHEAWLREFIEDERPLASHSISRAGSIGGQSAFTQPSVSTESQWSALLESQDRMAVLNELALEGPIQYSVNSGDVDSQSIFSVSGLAQAGASDTSSSAFLAAVPRQRVSETPFSVATQAALEASRYLDQEGELIATQAHGTGSEEEESQMEETVHEHVSHDTERASMLDSGGSFDASVDSQTRHALAIPSTPDGLFASRLRRQPSPRLFSTRRTPDGEGMSEVSELQQRQMRQSTGNEDQTVLPLPQAAPLSGRIKFRDGRLERDREPVAAPNRFQATGTAVRISRFDSQETDSDLFLDQHRARKGQKRARNSEADPRPEQHVSDDLDEEEAALQALLARRARQGRRETSPSLDVEVLDAVVIDEPDEDFFHQRQLNLKRFLAYHDEDGAPTRPRTRAAARKEATATRARMPRFPDEYEERDGEEQRNDALPQASMAEQEPGLSPPRDQSPDGRVTRIVTATHMTAEDRNRLRLAVRLEPDSIGSFEGDADPQLNAMRKQLTLEYWFRRQRPGLEHFPDPHPTGTVSASQTRSAARDAVLLPPDEQRETVEPDQASQAGDQEPDGAGDQTSQQGRRRRAVSVVSLSSSDEESEPPSSRRPRKTTSTSRRGPSSSAASRPSQQRRPGRPRGAGTRLRRTTQDAGSSDAAQEHGTQDTERPVRKRARSKPWTPEETTCFLNAMYKLARFKKEQPFYKVYSEILSRHGKFGSEDRILKDRDNVALKDKARVELLRMKRQGEVIPYWKGLYWSNVFEQRANRSRVQNTEGGGRRRQRRTRAPPASAMIMESQPHDATQEEHEDVSDSEDEPAADATTAGAATQSGAQEQEQEEQEPDDEAHTQRMDQALRDGLVAEVLSASQAQEAQQAQDDLPAQEDSDHEDDDQPTLRIDSRRSSDSEAMEVEQELRSDADLAGPSTWQPGRSSISRDGGLPSASDPQAHRGEHERSSRRATRRYGATTGGGPGPRGRRFRALSLDVAEPTDDDSDVAVAGSGTAAAANADAQEGSDQEDQAEAGPSSRQLRPRRSTRVRNPAYGF